MKSDYKTPEFLAKNPVGYLPFLEDGDFALAESAAIAEYGELQLFFSGSVLVVSVYARRERRQEEGGDEYEWTKKHTDPPPPTPHLYDDTL